MGNVAEQCSRSSDSKAAEADGAIPSTAPDQESLTLPKSPRATGSEDPEKGNPLEIVLPTNGEDPLGGDDCGLRERAHAADDMHHDLQNGEANKEVSVDDGTGSEPRRSCCERCAESIDGILNQSIAWSIFVMLLTVYALFADDVKVLVIPKSMDDILFYANLGILGVFLLEFFLCCLVQQGYACSLSAMMDFLAAASLIPFEQLLASFNSVGDSISVARVARAARALRILRSMRAAAMALKSEARVRNISRIAGKTKVSVLADTLLKSTNIKMLLGILCLLMVTTLLDYTESDRSAEAGLVLLDRTYGQSFWPSPAAVQAEANWTKVWHDYRTSVEGEKDDTLRNLVLLQVWGTTYFQASTEDLRAADIEMHFGGDSSWRARSLSIVSTQRMNQRKAVNSILGTIFNVIVIIVWAWSFRRDHQKLVIAPVMRMVNLLKEMALDPRQAVEKGKNKGTLSQNASEMEVIESCIGRFGGLLKVGFGEAGMGIIARNLGQESFDPVVPGRVVQAVFGFCDIRNFTDCCEVLKKDTMIFTNRVADIVHGLVEESGGSVNKNIGDAFLSVWKLKDASDPTSATLQESDEAKAPSPRPIRSKSFVHHLTGAENICEETLKAFLKMNEAVKTSKSIQEFSQDERLQRKLPGYRVKMGSGLHLGWAIEGAVGSSHKVDATYLSPHVNMSSRLEAATKQYGVNILMSNALVDEFGPRMKAECRAIDHVTVKGSEVPIMLYVHFPSESPELDDSQRSKFMELWTKAFDLYQSGKDWKQAAGHMTSCLKILPRDEPAKVLLEVIRENGEKAPSDWRGYRALTSK